MPELLGFAPNVDRRIEGVFSGGNAFAPSRKGIQSVPSEFDRGIAALSGPCLGAYTGRLINAASRTIAGIAADLFELTGLTWTNRSSTPGVYTTGGGRWRFTQFGDFIIATNRADQMQVSGGGAFANLGGTPPKARFIDTVGLFVIAADTTEAVNGDQGDRWWCSALGNHADWVPSIATQSATGRILTPEGPILASKRLGNQWIIYKQRSIHVGTYLGGDVIWDFQQIPGDIGCISHDSVVDIEVAHIFAGEEGFYIFDGVRVEEIGLPVKEHVFTNLLKTGVGRITGYNDIPNNRVYFYYPSQASSGDPEMCVIYDYETNKWGVDNRTIQAVVEHIAGSITWDALGTTIGAWGPAGTFDQGPNISFDNPFWTATDSSPGVFNASNKLLTLTGTPGVASLEMWEVGNDSRDTGISSVIPRFSVLPTSASMVPAWKEYSAKPMFTVGSSVAFSRGRFNHLRTAAIHKMTLNLTGTFSLDDIGIEART